MNRSEFIEDLSAIPSPPFFGARVIDIPLQELYAMLNLPALYRVGWGAKNASGEKWDEYTRDFSARLEKLKSDQEQDPWLMPRAAYGYWTCAAQDEAILLYPQDGDKPISFPVPRQNYGKRLSLTDYFAPAGAAVRDVAALQLVTVGRSAVEHVHKLNANGDLVEAFFAHGLAVQLTETAARWVHQRIRGELGIGPKQGRRYSWGYPPIPDLTQETEVVRLLKAKEYLDIELTSGFQFVPEFSTAALVVHHPQAVYFRIDE